MKNKKYTFSKSQIDALELCTYFVSHKDTILGVMAFGSFGRGDATNLSDLDLIYIVDYPRNEARNYYIPYNLFPISIDLNILALNDITKLLIKPDWQRRFNTSRFLDDFHKSEKELYNWIATIKGWINTQEAKLHRLKTHEHDLVSLIKTYNGIDDDYNPLKDHIVNEILLLTIFSKIEIADSIPFNKRNIFEQFIEYYDCNELMNYYPFEISNLSKNGALDIELFWKHYKSVINNGRKILTHYNPSLIGRNHELLINQDIEIYKESLSKIKNLYAQNKWLNEKNEIIIESANKICCEISRLTNSQQILLSEVIKKPPKKSIISNNIRLYEFDEKRQRHKIIIPTGGCRIQNCIFCVLSDIAHYSPTINWIKNLEDLPEKMEELCIYTDGSFFDDNELSKEDRIKIAKIINKKEIKQLSIESLPTFINKNSLSQFLEVIGYNIELNLCFGLQSSNPVIRHNILGNCITNKDFESLFSFRDFSNIKFRVYLLFGKPLLTINEDIKDIEFTIEYLSNLLFPEDTITINQLLIDSNSQLGILYNLGLYNLPNLCKMRDLVQELQLKYNKLNILPGNVSVMSCVEKFKHNTQYCINCLSWLESSERLIKETTPDCINKTIDIYELPWTIFGNFNNRCHFIKSFLQKNIYS